MKGPRKKDSELEWKERKKFQRRLIAAKKKLCEMEQQHVFHGFRCGDRDQTSLLANQIVTVNSKLLQQALQNIATPSSRHNLLQILSAVPRSNTLKLSDPCRQLQRKGHSFTSNGKAAIFLVLRDIEEINRSNNSNFVDSERSESAYDLVKALLDDRQKFVKIEDRSSVPLVLVCSAHSLSSLQELFSIHDYFEFDPEKVWFLEEEKLPVVSNSLDKQLGSGGIISLLSSHDLLDNLSEMGVEYIEICSIHQNYENGRTLLGLVDSRKADLGIQLSENKDLEENFDVIFSTSFMKRWVKQINKLQFQTGVASNSYVEMVDKNWVDVPSDLNSYEFHCSIYNCLDVASINKVCVLDSTGQYMD